PARRRPRAPSAASRTRPAPRRRSRAAPRRRGGRAQPAGCPAAARACRWSGPWWSRPGRSRRRAPRRRHRRPPARGPGRRRSGRRPPRRRRRAAAPVPVLRGSRSRCLLLPRYGLGAASGAGRSQAGTVVGDSQRPASSQVQTPRWRSRKGRVTVLEESRSGAGTVPTEAPMTTPTTLNATETTSRSLPDRASDLIRNLTAGTSVLSGQYRIELESGTWWWSDEVYRMYGYQPDE